VRKALLLNGVLISLLIQLFVPPGPRWSETAIIDAFGVPICSSSHRPLVNSRLRSAA
jgi:hypothetical protein